MAGYIMGFNDIDSINFCAEHGIYSTNLSDPSNGLWRIHHEGTFADFATMKDGDNIYFFIDRKIYGIGILTNIKGDCKFNNYPESDVPVVPGYGAIKGKMILEGIVGIKNRWVCTFKYSPEFFKIGIDMDDVLSSDPDSFKMLRAFWKVSFIKIDDAENKALKDVIMKRNEKYIGCGDKGFVYIFDESYHLKIKSLLLDEQYRIKADNILSSCSEGDSIRHEMAIEAGLLWGLSNSDRACIKVFGEWDYLSHQVIASPFKPLDYIDKMDIFGYKYIPTFDTISKYLVIELKKGIASTDSIDQLMKYVDWIHHEYAHGDYSMIEAYVVAYGFNADVAPYKEETCVRNYAIGSRPTLNKKWTEAKLVEYRYDAGLESLKFTGVR